jgi:AcrR family transcriptional regulator
MRVNRIIRAEAPASRVAWVSIRRDHADSGYSVCLLRLDDARQEHEASVVEPFHVCWIIHGLISSPRLAHTVVQHKNRHAFLFCDPVTGFHKLRISVVGRSGAQPAHSCGCSEELILEHLRAKVLSQIRPETFVDESANWQQRKSGETRIRILESAIDCLTEKGYAGLSINEAVKRSGVSRGAMHHHFPTRLDLVGALIEYTFYQRMHHFLGDYFAAVQTHEDFVATASELHWKSVQTREYAAYIELAIAARTDEALNAFFLPAARRFDKVWLTEMIRAFPQWEKQWDALQRASDLTMAAHMGLLLHRPVFRAGKRTSEVRLLIADMVKQIYQGAFL